MYTIHALHDSSGQVMPPALDTPAPHRSHAAREPLLASTPRLRVRGFTSVRMPYPLFQAHGTHAELVGVLPKVRRTEGARVTARSGSEESVPDCSVATSCVVAADAPAVTSLRPREGTRFMSNALGAVSGSISSHPAGPRDAAAGSEAFAAPHRLSKPVRCARTSRVSPIDRPRYRTKDTYHCPQGAHSATPPAVVRGCSGSDNARWIKGQHDVQAATPASATVPRALPCRSSTT